MRKPSSGLVLSVAVIAGISGAPAVLAGAERASALPLVVVVDDRAQVLPGTLDQAVKEATRLYRQAGVAAEWPAAGAHTGEEAANEDRLSLQGFRVRLIIQPALRGGATSKFLMGAAPETARACGGTVYVFHDQVADFASARRLDPALVMGTVMAHEVGHLLLRQRGHSTEGLMRAGWDSHDWERAGMGLLLFSSRDVATIGATLSSCRR